jgi:putative ABC transport system substrate-binding protein
MRRRELFGLVAGIAVARPAILFAQPSGKQFRIGQITGGTAASRAPLHAAFRIGLRDHGYIEGQNLVVESRYAEGKFERLPGLVKELLAWRPDVIFVSTTPAALAAKAATTIVPIVFVGVADPLGVGLIASLSRPGSNITGITNIGAELAGKRIELLKELIPSATRIAVLINPNDQNAPLQMKSAKSVADQLRIQIDPVLEIRSGDDLKDAFEAAVRARVSAALRMIDPLTVALRQQTVRHAAEHRLPVMYPFRGDVSAGGLMSYGPNLLEQYRQAATFVHKILKGAKPSDIPVEQPVKFELAINVKTAKTLGLAVPATLLARADEVFE